MALKDVKEVQRWDEGYCLPEDDVTRRTAKENNVGGFASRHKPDALWNESEAIQWIVAYMLHDRLYKPFGFHRSLYAADDLPSRRSIPAHEGASGRCLEIERFPAEVPREQGHPTEEHQANLQYCNYL